MTSEEFINALEFEVSQRVLTPPLGRFRRIICFLDTAFLRPKELLEVSIVEAEVTIALHERILLH